MNKPQTAEEYIEGVHGDQLGLFTRDEVKSAMVQFAKQWVEYALNNASEDITLLCGNSKKENGKYQENCGEWCGGCNNQVVDKDSIVNSINLNDIK